MSTPRPLVVVPARGGSKGVPGKNLRPVGGVSLVGRAVRTGLDFAAAAGRADVVVLIDTDDEAIAAEGRRHGGEAPFLRPPALARDETATIDNVLHAIDAATARWGAFDCVVLLQPTSPLRALDDVLACWHEFVASGAESVVSVSPAPHPVEIAMRRADDGVLRWVAEPPGGVVRRQAYPPSWFTNGAVYVNRVDSLRARRAFLVPGVTRGVPTSAPSAIDIDTPDDLALADALARGLGLAVPATAPSYAPLPASPTSAS